MDAPGAMVLLTQLARRVYHCATEDVLRMSMKQYITLVTLCESGGTLNQSALAERLHLDASTLVLMLNSLEDAGHVERRRDPHDRRRHIVEVTAAGRRALTQAERRMETVEDEVLAELGPEERAQLRSLLARALTDAPPVVDAG